jgi:hypothetical protein
LLNSIVAGTSGGGVFQTLSATAGLDYLWAQNQKADRVTADSPRTPKLVSPEGMERTEKEPLAVFTRRTEKIPAYHLHLIKLCFLCSLLFFWFGIRAKDCAIPTAGYSS